MRTINPSVGSPRPPARDTIHSRPLLPSRPSARRTSPPSLLNLESRMMQRFTSMTLCSICGFRFRIPTLRPGVSTVDENAVAGNDGQAPQSAIAEFSEGAVRKPHAVSTPGAFPGLRILMRRPQGGRLDALSRLRIQPIAIKFTSPDPHGSGGMADVTQATYIWQDGSDEQVVAVKQVRHRRDQERKKFENVRDDIPRYQGALILTKCA